MSLLKEALDKKKGANANVISDEEIELTIAWVHGDISLSQATRAYSDNRGIKHGQGIYALFARALKKHINDKHIQI